MIEIFLGQIPEAIYFALFMIYAKDLKEKRILFTILMIVEYLLLLHSFPYSLLAHVLFVMITYIILKILYKSKAQITDIFTFGISSIILIFINAFLYFSLYKLIDNYIIYVIIDRILSIIFLIIFKNKLNNIQKIYKILWNRNDKIKKPIKSTTFRCANLVIFNLMFYIINIAMLYCNYINSK